jgi:hypothetical protein
MKNASNTNKGQRPIVVASITVLLALMVIVVLLAIRWFLFQRYVNTTDKYHELYEIVPEDMLDFADYCNSAGEDSFEIGTVNYSDEKAYIGVRGVDSFEEFNEVILTMSNFFNENPDYILNHRSLEIVMNGDDFYIECFWNTPSTCVNEIRTINFYAPREALEGELIDVQRICILNGDSLSEDRIAILETMYPNAEVVLE